MRFQPLAREFGVPDGAQVPSGGKDEIVGLTLDILCAGQLLRSLILSGVTLFGVSPILQTLTRDTTDDSIWSLSTLLLMINVCFRDYRTGNEQETR